MTMRRAGAAEALVLVGLAFVLLAGQASAQIKLEGSTPPDGAALDGPDRTVRVWFETAPPVDGSSLAISGPGNRAKIEGLHTMGENDLMGRVTGPMPNGEWTMTWTTVGADGEAKRTLDGVIDFCIERGH